MQTIRLHIAAIICLVVASGAFAAPMQDSPALADYSLEQLGDIVVTSVVRQQTRLADAPASVYVISGADIRRSGAVTITDALRLAPNLQVAQADARNFAISARGFSNTLANKLLVLIDGRSIYSPLFSGVFWDMQDVVMDDVERIEVISGPGSTIWGANAVNGVINIITRSPRDTKGGLWTGDAGRRGAGSAFRYGGQLVAGVDYRVYAKAQKVADTLTQTGQNDGSGMKRAQAGFRIDWGNGRDAWTISGDAYRGRLGQPMLDDFDTSGANLIARMTRRLSDNEQLRAQLYLDHSNRHQKGAGGDRLNTVDLELQHGLRVGTQHNIVWGGGYRQSRDRVMQGPVFQFHPALKDLRWANVFAQDEIALNAALNLTLGLKFEHNNYTGTEALPNARLAWHLDRDNLVWSAVSRTVRAPARIDRDLVVELGAAGLPFSIDAGPEFQAETARVLEIGYRRQPAAGLSFSATAFYADYDRLRTLEPVGPTSRQFQNKAKGRARGVELWGRWQATPSWRIDAGAVVQDIDTALLPESGDVTTAAGLGSNDASSYWTLRSSHQIRSDLVSDLSLRYVGSLPEPQVPAYRELDARIAWRPRADVEVALAGVNLLKARHLEFRPAGVRQYPQRAVQVQVAVHF